MNLYIIKSGSSGNCYVFTDSDSNQLIVECGVRYDNILEHINPTKVQGCIISHEHKDHSLSKEKLQLIGIDTYDNSNMQNGKPLKIGKWVVLPISVKHGDCPCFAFIIKNIIENKEIFFATDLEKLPNVADKRPYDLMLLEANYSETFLVDKLGNINSRFFDHNSLENTLLWLSKRLYKPRNLGLIHLSSNGLISTTTALIASKSHSDNVFVATKNKEVNF